MAAPHPAFAVQPAFGVQPGFALHPALAPHVPFGAHAVRRMAGAHCATALGAAPNAPATATVAAPNP
jgi:hypothetical protein